MNAKNKLWLKAAGIRALKTMAQTALATISAEAMLEGVNWLTVASATALAGVLSLLMSVEGLPEVRAVETVSGGGSNGAPSRGGKRRSGESSLPPQPPSGKSE